MTEPRAQAELRAGAATATIDAAHGGRIATLELDGRALLRPRAASPGTWAFWGSYPLLPWTNRIPGGVFTFEGVEHHVEVNWDDGTALHGLAADVPWTFDQITDTTADLHVDVTGGPYVARGSQRFELQPDRLEQTLSVENRAPVRLPFGLGIHPWFVAGNVRVPANAKWPSVGALPTGPPEPVTGDEDLRQPRVPPLMDQCYTDVFGTDADVPGLTLSWSGPISQVCVYTGEQGWVCVEPVTMANDGFRLLAEGSPQSGVVGLDPGESMTVRYSFAFTAGQSVGQ